MEIISRADATSAGLTHYFTGVPCKHGHVAARYTKNTRCVPCVNDAVYRSRALNPEVSKQGLKDAQRRYHAAHRDDRNQVSREYRENNGEAFKRTKQNWNRNNRQRISESKRDYHRRNRDYILQRMRDRYGSDTLYRLGMRARSMVGRVLTSLGTEKIRPTFEVLGYTTNDLRRHLEALFVDGMTWENYGEWHIDHKIPVSLLIYWGITDPAIINALWNLQPLWAFDNISKGNRFVSQ